MAQASKVSYPEQKLSKKGIDKLRISGVKGHVKLTGRPGKVYRLKVRHSKGKKWQDWMLSVDRQGKALVLEVFSVAYGKQWRAHVAREHWPEFDVQIEGPAVPATVSWREGEMEIAKWAAPVNASLIKGKISVREAIGDYDLQAGRADVTIDEMGGNLSLKGDSGHVRVTRLSGNLDLNWVDGDVELNKIVGEGNVYVERGLCEIKQFVGKLRAEGDSAKWRLSRSQLNDVEIKSHSGGVDWDWKEGGARVFLTSDKGEILGRKPGSILDGEGRKVSEFTVGKRPFAQVFVKTKSGPIHFRQ